MTAAESCFEESYEAAGHPSDKILQEHRILRCLYVMEEIS